MFLFKRFLANLYFAIIFLNGRRKVFNLKISKINPLQKNLICLKERAQWGNPIEFILTVIGYAVGKPRFNNKIFVNGLIN